MACTAHTRRTKIREGERENLPGNKSPRAPFQHPGHSANKAAWQRTAGRGDARDWPVSVRVGGHAWCRNEIHERFALNVSVERRGAWTLEGRAACACFRASRSPLIVF